MRLNEVAQHAWDARVGLDPAAELDHGSAVALAEHFTGGLGFLLGFVAKPAEAPSTVRLDAGDVALVIDDGRASLVTSVEDPTATFRGSIEEVVRLVGGRLRPGLTPAGTDVTGNVSLDDLRRVFPGY